MPGNGSITDGPTPLTAAGMPDEEGRVFGWYLPFVPVFATLAAGNTLDGACPLVRPLAVYGGLSLLVVGGVWSLLPAAWSRMKTLAPPRAGRGPFVLWLGDVGVAVLHTALGLSELGNRGDLPSAVFGLTFIVAGIALAVVQWRGGRRLVSAGGGIFWGGQLWVMWLNLTLHWAGFGGEFTQGGGFWRE